MKKNIWIFALSVVFVSFFLSSCVTTTDDGYKCIKTPTPCGSVNSCSDGSQSFYELDGTRYWCDGSDCSDTSEEVAEIMCGKNATEESKEISKEKLIEGSYDVLEEKTR